MGIRKEKFAAQLENFTCLKRFTQIFTQ